MAGNPRNKTIRRNTAGQRQSHNKIIHKGTVPTANTIKQIGRCRITAALAPRDHKRAVADSAPHLPA